MSQSVLRKNDMRVEREIALFLDQTLYGNRTDIFSSFHRTDDMSSQFNGSDLVISIPSRGIYDAVVDEKCQAHRAGKPLGTFAMELSTTMSNGNIMTGWFLDKSKTTEYYMLIWINKVRPNDGFITAEDILEAEYALVRRSKIFEYLSDNGYPYDKLTEKDAEIRSIAKNGQYDKDGKDFWFYYSESYHEKPVNLVIRKKVYINLSEYHGVIKMS